MTIRWPGRGPGGPNKFHARKGAYTLQRSQAQVGRLRVLATTLKTQVGLVHVATPSSHNQTGLVRVRVTTARTQQGVCRVQVVTPQTQVGHINVLAPGSQTQVGHSRVQATTTKTQLGICRVRATTLQTQMGRINVGPNNLRVRAPAVAAYSAQYGGFTLDETNGIMIVSPDPITSDNSIFGTWSCTFRIRVRPEVSTGTEAGDDSLFQTWINAAETALKIPRQELIVKMGQRVLRDWNFTKAPQTAFLIFPELTCINTSRRNYLYRFTVKCQFPGNIPANAFRRESTTQIGDSLRMRRTCDIVATWTSSPGVTALGNYQVNGDTFFNSYLPPNFTDQYGNVGTWVRADEIPVSFNDENSLCTGRRLYWECFAARRESQAKDIKTLPNREEFRATSTWVATTGFTALQNYVSGGDAWYGKVLPSLSNPDSQWVLVDEEPDYNDPNGILNVTRTYLEVVRGLREFESTVTTNANQLRTIVVSGTYFSTGSVTAKTNYGNDILTLVNGILAEYGVTRYEHFSIPKIEKFGTTRKTFMFQWTINELAYPQGQGVVDDPNITISTLNINGETPYEMESVPNGISVNRLQLVTAHFTAVIDYTKSQDPANIWKNGARAFVLNAVSTKLGSNISVDLLNEQIAVGLHNNTLTGTFHLLVTGGSVIMLRLEQELIQAPGRDFVPRADGTQFSNFPYYDVAEKILIRSYIMEYVIANGAVPDPFASSSVSSLGMIQTGVTAQASIDAQNTKGALGLNTWFIDRRAATPYSVKDSPGTRGLGFNTNIRRVIESWKYMEQLESGT